MLTHRRHWYLNFLRVLFEVLLSSRCGTGTRNGLFILVQELIFYRPELNLHTPFLISTHTTDIGSIQLNEHLFSAFSL